MVNSLIKIVDIILILVGIPKASKALTYKLNVSVSSALVLTVIIPNVKVLLNNIYQFKYNSAIITIIMIFHLTSSQLPQLY